MVGDTGLNSPLLIVFISIHALREEGDVGVFFRHILHTDFYPRPPRGGRPKFLPVLLPAVKFLSTPSARRATRNCGHALTSLLYFYPRPPRGGRHVFHVAVYKDLGISIHALREEGDWLNGGYWDNEEVFLSTPSARRATRSQPAASAPRENFYPRPPRGGRHSASNSSTIAVIFLSTPSARRATAKTETKSLFSNKLYNILHEFRRALIYNGSKNYPNHAK